jgi:hypothetical protein
MPGDLPRPLTAVERAVLDRLLGVEFDGVEVLRDQVKDLLVTGGCGCGCPTINFQEGPSGGLGIVTEAWTPTKDRSVLLFVDGKRRLQSLELQWMTDAPPTEWPDPDELIVQAA